MQLNVWCSTGTVGSYLNHPRQGKTQLFRRSVNSVYELQAILTNPRVHTDKGYQRVQPAPPPAPAPKRQRSVACPGCSKCYYTMGDTAQHFESGRCNSCPGQENARAEMYQFARQREHAAGANGMFTNGGQQMLTFTGAGQQDWSAGYQAGGKNYHCPGCRKGFTTVGGMLNHMQAKPQCSQSSGNLALM